MKSRAVALVLAALLLVAGSLGAAAADQSVPASLHMEGSAEVGGSRPQPRLLVSADATDSSGLHLDATLTPSITSGQEREGEGGEERESRRGEHRSSSPRQRDSGSTDLAGSFTLSGPGMGEINGHASGQLGTGGDGSITLTDQTGAVQLQGSFSVDGSGAMQLDLTGSVPGAASTAPAAAATTAGQTATQQDGDHFFWYLARAAGLSAYLLLFFNVVLGLAVHSRFLDAVMARWRYFDLHQFTGLLAMGFLALHGLALLGDHYIGFTLPQLLVPLASSYRPEWTALGIIGLYLLATVVASSYLRSHIGYRLWRSLHYLSFVAYLSALAHGIMAGTDTGEPWARALYLGTGTTVALLALRRFRNVPERPGVSVADRRSAGGVS